MINAMHRRRALSSLLRALETAALVFLGLLTAQALLSPDGMHRAAVVDLAITSALLVLFLFPYELLRSRRQRDDHPNREP